MIPSEKNAADLFLKDTGSCQTALVTGASRGIGRAVALELAGSGRYVFVNYIKNEAAAQATLSEIIKIGGKGEIICFDVADFSQAEAGIKFILEKKRKIDILVNNAGIAEDMLMVRMKQKQWQSVLDTNLTGFYNITRPVVKNMIKNRFGRIVNITSASGQTGQAGQVNYSASKAGLIGATKALSREVSSRNITVNAVSPGFIQTDMVEKLKPEEITRVVPMQRPGTPEDVAFAVAFLCSSRASYITGQVLGVNGGIV